MAACKLMSPCVLCLLDVYLLDSRQSVLCLLQRLCCCCLCLRASRDCCHLLVCLQLQHTRLQGSRLQPVRAAPTHLYE